MVVESNNQHESLGQELKRLRMHRGWTVELASKETKIKPEQIADIEADNYVNFPSVAYVRGFVRIYARALGLDDRKVVAKLDGKIVDDGSGLVPLAALEQLPPVTKSPDPAPRRVGSQIIAVVVIATIILVVYMVWKVGGLKEYKTAQGYDQTVKAQPPANTEAEAPPKATPVGQPVPTAILGEKQKTVIAPKALPVSQVEPKDKVEKALPVDKPAPVAVPVPSNERIAPRAEVIKPAAPETVNAAPVFLPAATEGGNIPRAEPILPKATLSLESSHEVWLRVILNGNEQEPVYDGVMRAGQTLSWEGQSFYLKARPPSALSATYNGKVIGKLSTENTVQEFRFP